MSVCSQQQDIEAEKLGRVIGVGGRLREELAGSRHDGRSGFGVTEIVYVGVKKDLVRADEVLLKSRCISMVAMGEALGFPVEVDGAVGGLGRQSASWAAGAT